MNEKPTLSVHADLLDVAVSGVTEGERLEALARWLEQQHFRPDVMSIAAADLRALYRRAKDAEQAAQHFAAPEQKTCPACGDFRVVDVKASRCRACETEFTAAPEQQQLVDALTYGVGITKMSYTEDGGVAVERVDPEAMLIAAPERCSSCDDTGDVYRADGEWLGKCSCQAGAPEQAEQPTVEVPRELLSRIIRNGGVDTLLAIDELRALLGGGGE